MSGKDSQARTEQAAAIPFRLVRGQLEFCLITTRKRKKWGIPKGIIDPGETVEETACKESLEEAGLVGRPLSPPVGSYQYRKWKRDLSVTVVLLDVEEIHDSWEESGVRDRRWADVETALQLVGNKDVRDLLQTAADRLLEPDDRLPAAG